MPSGPKCVVVVGANVAGIRAAETLRAEGFDGSLTLINGERALPYNRPPLSKEVLTGKTSLEEVVHRDDDYYRTLGIELRSGEPATALDLRRQTVKVGRDTLPFDGLIIATGASARTIPELQDREGVYVMRSTEDAQQIRAAFERKPRVVILGAGFIGSEVAASARSLGLEVTIVELLPVPLVRALGENMGKACAKLHHDNGTDLRCAASVHKIEGHGRVERVRLANGTCIDADLLIIGVGAIPNISWLSDSGLNLANGLVCDETLNAGHPAVFAAGDLVWWPNRLFGKGMRCEHWTNGAEQGRAAARNLLVGRGNAKPYLGSCYFWSDQYGSRIQFVGLPRGEASIVQGSFDENKFVAFYKDGNRVIGALGMNSPKALMKAKLMIEKQTIWEVAVDAVDTA